jgi:four helix bundle protein
MREATATAKAPRSQADELEDRLVDFAVRIVRLSAALPRTAAGRHVAGQILRSGTSAAPNYAEARGAESTADFIHKVRIVFKELNETLIWLRVIQRAFEARVNSRYSQREPGVVQNLCCHTKNGQKPTIEQQITNLKCQMSNVK